MKFIKESQIKSNMKTLAYLDPGFKMTNKSFKRKLLGFKKYQGSFEEMSKQILDECYVGSKKYEGHKYYNVSNGHFKQFYCRDFGMITEGLLKLGYKEEVFSTLRYALFIFKRHNKVATAISKDTPVDYFSPAADSLPFLVRSIRLALNAGMQNADIKPYLEFLQDQVNVYYDYLYDLKKGHVKKDIELSSSKDHYVRPSSCYDNSAAIGLAIELRKLNVILKKKAFTWPINIKEAKERFVELFWNKTYFFDDLTKGKYVSSDANTMPFYWNVILDKDMKKLAMDAIIEAKLDDFLPVQYTNFRDESKELKMPEFFAPNYEGTSYWLHVGLCYLEVLKSTDKKRFEFNMSNVKREMLKYQNFLEVFSDKCVPYSSWAYSCDESMSWIAGFVALDK